MCKPGNPVTKKRASHILIDSNLPEDGIVWSQPIVILHFPQASGISTKISLHFHLPSAAAVPFAKLTRCPVPLSLFLLLLLVGIFVIRQNSFKCFWNCYPAGRPHLFQFILQVIILKTSYSPLCQREHSPINYSYLMHRLTQGISDGVSNNRFHSLLWFLLYFITQAFHSLTLLPYPLYPSQGLGLPAIFHSPTLRTLHLFSYFSQSRFTLQHPL